MLPLSTDMLSLACRTFLQMAYPAGEDAIPASRRIYLDLPSGRNLWDYHLESPLPASSFQLIRNEMGENYGCAIRLGCSHFPHLKLRVQEIGEGEQKRWLFTVDTHDSFSRHFHRPPSDHPDSVGWRILQEANSELKEKIERAWAKEGLLTFNGLLWEGLEQTGE